MLLQGLFVPLTCPFDREEKLFLHKLESNVRRYSLGPAAGLVALVPDGEATGLTDAECVAVLQAIGGSAAKHKVLLAGVQRASVAAALAMAEAADTAGFDALLLAQPYNFFSWAEDRTEQEQERALLFYQVIADRSPLPVVLWSAAATPSGPLPSRVVAALARHPNVIGIIDADLSADSSSERLDALVQATADVRREVTVTTVFEAVTRRMLADAAASGGLVTISKPQGGSGGLATSAPPVPAIKTRTRTVGFQILSGGVAHGMVPLFQSGAAGAMPALAACAPQSCFEAYAAWKDGDEALAAERAARLQPADAILAEIGPAAVKYGCDWNGYYGGAPRLPRLLLTAAQKSEVVRAIGDVRN